MLDFADRIICMEETHRAFIVNHYDIKYESKIEVMNLGDTETFMSEQLIELLELKFKLNPTP